MGEATETGDETGGHVVMSETLKRAPGVLIAPRHGKKVPALHT